MVRNCLLSVLILASFCCKAQDSVSVLNAQNSNSIATLKKKNQDNNRKWFIGSASLAGYGGSFIFLNEAWYKGYPRSSFHTFNDGGEWMQMDKIGHAWTAYHTSRITSNVWKWAGVNQNQSIVLGTGTGLLYMLSIEYLDGRSAEWGWSWPDAGADIFGATLFASQQLTWKEQKISIKFSSHQRAYPTELLEQRADALFGQSLPQRILKDYNTQTYWLSLNMQSLFKTNTLPRWLNIAVGYGADGMFGGYDNVAKDAEGNITFDRRDIKRYRQWYLAPDIDLTKIKTRSKFLHSVFTALNILKVPAPAFEFSNKQLKFKALAF